MNLYSNAIKFSDKHGSILVKVEKVSKGQLIIISVIDSGLGIKKKDKGKLFKMFGSIKDEQKKINMNGIGLGLVISKLLVEKFNGNINF
jgi:signal transduction histidine kinase